MFGGRSPRAVRKSASAADEATLFGVDPDLVASSMPRIFWVELTSTCPYDCIFCIHRERFGAGRHMDYAVYAKLIAELDSPDAILLSYFGDSLYYPRLLDAISLAHPGLAVHVSNPDAELCPPLRESPASFPAGLPDSARIHSCYQSPFETARVAAGGDVVPCALLAEVPLGSLRDQSLQAIWRGERYRELRRRYALDPYPACRKCTWKMAFAPHALRQRIVIAEGMSAQLLRGWHAHEGVGLLWSHRNALAVLSNAGRFGHVAVEGILPHGPGGAPNSLRLICNGVAIGEVRNATGAFLPFDVRLRLPEAWEQLYIEFTTAHLHRPSLHGTSTDSRDLGAGIQRIEALD